MRSTIKVVLQVLHNSEGSVHDRRQRVGQHDLFLAHAQHFLHYAYCLLDLFPYVNNALNLLSG